MCVVGVGAAVRCSDGTGAVRLGGTVRQRRTGTVVRGGRRWVGARGAGSRWLVALCSLRNGDGAAFVCGCDDCGTDCAAFGPSKKKQKGQNNSDTNNAKVHPATTILHGCGEMNADASTSRTADPNRIKRPTAKGPATAV